ncbi:LysM peptidoglycan-binding domain-containing protein [bacterium]|nr:LysM peptidoglycan-binding domain-containing protein [bacterium]
MDHFTRTRSWLYISGVIGLIVGLMSLTGCATSGKKSTDTTSQVPIEHKYGILKGPVYFNEFYKFQLTAPHGWQAVRPKTETVVRMTPQEKEIKIEIIVQEGALDPVVENYLPRIIKQGEYELLSQNSLTFQDGPALQVELKSTTGVVPLKKNLLLIQRFSFLYQIYLIGPLETVSSYEKSFEEALNSFRFTDSLIEGIGAYDCFSYTVQPTDTLKGLATRFLNDPNEAVTIAHFNQITTMMPDRQIDIPRYRHYVVQEGDTEETLSRKFYNTHTHFYLVPPYNADINTAELLKPGTEIKIPMYFLYTVQPGDTLPALALSFLRSEDKADLIPIYNNHEQIRVGSVIKIPLLWAERDYIVYTVKRDDSLSSIAEYFTGSINNFPILAEFNNIQPPFEIGIGQQIKIPKDMIKERPKTQYPKKTTKPETKTEDGGPETTEPDLELEEELEGPIYEPE